MAPDIAQLLEVLRERERQPAAGGVVVGLHGIVTAGVTGLRVLQSAESVLLDDRFHLGSLTKAMTATTIGFLVDGGALRWETKIGEVFPEVSQDYSSVTVTHLLQHQARLAPYTHIVAGSLEAKVLASLDGEPRDQRHQFMVEVLKQPPSSEPGKMSYSNAGYSIVAHLVEMVLGTPWEELVRTHLFARLGMETADFGWPATPEHPEQPWGHWKGKDGSLVVCPPDDDYRLGPQGAGSGDIHCTVEDLGRFLHAHIVGLNQGSSLFRHLHTPEDGYALGWAVSQYSEEKLGLVDETMSVHAGTAGTFSAQMVVLHRAGMGFAVVTNGGGADAILREGCGKLMFHFLPKGRSSS